MSSFPEGFYKRVNGFITEPEAELLYRLASHIPEYGTVVEIGAYQGRSTCALAFGAEQQGGSVYSIDSHPSYMAGGTSFSSLDNQAYYEAISEYHLGDVVRTINLPSEQVIICWNYPIDLLWIDGNHDAGQVRLDWYGWSYHADLIALHDTAGHHPAVTQLLQEILDSSVWTVQEKVDSITVLRRTDKGVS